MSDLKCACMHCSDPFLHAVCYLSKFCKFLDALHVFVVLFACNMKSTNLKLCHSPTDKINAHNVRECSLRLTKHMRARCSSHWNELPAHPV